jgi:putative flippase GtrA
VDRENPREIYRQTVTRTLGGYSSTGRGFAVELGKFGTVGIFNFALDLFVFNLLLFTVFDHLPIGAKAISSVIAATSSYFMNRHWTWRHRARTGTRRELTIFLIMSAIALGITEGCLLISHYGLGLTSRLEDNLSANVVGLVLATAWRFWSFRRFVFLRAEDDPCPENRDRLVSARPMPSARKAGATAPVLYSE